MASRPCRPCEREKRIRQELSSENFPEGFPCNHFQVIDEEPEVPVVYPQTYEAERPCERCGKSVWVTVIVHSPDRIVFRGKCGHSWGSPPFQGWLSDKKKRKFTVPGER